MWRRVGSIAAVGVFVLVGLMAGQEAVQPRGAPDDYSVILRAPDPDLISLTAVLEDPAASAQLRRLGERYELFRVAVDTLAPEDGSFCGEEDAVGQLHIFDFAEPRTPASKRIRLAFKTCLIPDGAIQVTRADLAPISSRAVRTSLDRRPVLSTNLELDVLRAFVRDNRVLAELNAITARSVVIDLTLRSVSAASNLEDVGEFDVVVWTCREPVEVSNTAERESRSDAHLFSVSYDRSADALVSLQYRGP